MRRLDKRRPSCGEGGQDCVLEVSPADEPLPAPMTILDASVFLTSHGQQRSQSSWSTAELD